MKSKLLTSIFILCITFSFFIFIPSHVYATAAITYDNSTSVHSAFTQSSYTFNYTAGNHINEILIVGVSLQQPSAGAPTVASITYNGTALTKKISFPGSFIETELWYLPLNNFPTGSSYPITITLAGGPSRNAIVAGAYTYYNVDLNTPFSGTPITVSGHSQTVSITVPSSAGQLVIDNWATPSDDTFTLAGGQSAIWKVDTTGVNPAGFGSSKPGGGNVTLSWTTTANSDDYADIGIAINPAPDCTNGTSGCSACVAPLNTCSNNGSQTCSHTTLSGGSTVCNPIVFSNSCTINNCDTYHTCTSGSCALNNCTNGSINCGACGGGAANTCSNNGTQTCTHNLAPDSTTNCTQVTFGGTVCSYNNCSAGNFCSGGSCISSSYSISGNIFVDKDNSQRYNPPTDSLNTIATSITIKNSGGTTVATLNNITGTYSTSLPLGNYTVIFNGPPTGYYMTYPLSATPPQFAVTIGPGCTENSNDASCSSNNIINLNFGISNTPAWYQNVCSDIRQDAGIIDKLPNGMYAIIASPGCTNSPGIAFTGSTLPDFGLGQAAASPYNYVAGGNVTYPENYHTSTKIIHTSYAYLFAKTTQAGITPTDLATGTNRCTGGTLNPCTLPAGFPHGIYRANGDLHLQTYNFTGNQNFVFLVNGDLYLEGNVTIAQGSTVTFAATGNIIVPPAVGNANPADATANIEGFYTANQSFIINGTPNICTTGGSDKKLNISGAVITNAAFGGGSFSNNRTLCGNNALYPAVTVTERPDFFLFSPQFIKVTPHVWQETAP